MGITSKIDQTDLRILTELTKDASLSIPKLSKKIDVNPSMVYSRIKRLTRRSLIKKFTIEVNEEMLGYVVSAIIGLNIDAKQRDTIIEELMTLPEVREVAEVTGRFDVIISLRARSLDELDDVVFGKIGKINGLLHSETFVELKRRTSMLTLTVSK